MKARVPSRMSSVSKSAENAVASSSLATERSASKPRAMTPVQAVVLVATFGFLGPILGGTPVPTTLGQFINIRAVLPGFSAHRVMCGVFWGGFEKSVFFFTSSLAKAWKEFVYYYNRCFWVSLLSYIPHRFDL